MLCDLHCIPGENSGLDAGLSVDADEDSFEGERDAAKGAHSS